MRFRLTILGLMVLVFAVACVLSFSREAAARARRRDDHLKMAQFYEREAARTEALCARMEAGAEKEWWGRMAAHERAEAQAHRRLAETPGVPHKCADIPEPDIRAILGL